MMQLNAVLRPGKHLANWVFHVLWNEEAVSSISDTDKGERRSRGDGKEHKRKKVWSSKGCLSKDRQTKRQTWREVEGGREERQV
jgi:hypothetical protein